VNTIFLSQKFPTNLSHLKITNGLIDRIEVEGTGSLSVCTLSFFNGDEESIDHYEKIIFTKTDHPTQYILAPHKQILLSDFAYCILKIFSGNLTPTDSILLYYTVTPPIEKLA
jgi:hypothetical protein